MNKVLDFTAMLVVRTMNSVNKFKEDFNSDERGLTFVEIALMILVVVALAFVFKEQLIGLVEKIFGSVDVNDLQNPKTT